MRKKYIYLFIFIFLLSLFYLPNIAFATDTLYENGQNIVIGADGNSYPYSPATYSQHFIIYMDNSTNNIYLMEALEKCPSPFYRFTGSNTIRYFFELGGPDLMNYVAYFRKHILQNKEWVLVEDNVLYFNVSNITLLYSTQDIVDYIRDGDNSNPEVFFGGLNNVRTVNLPTDLVLRPIIEPIDLETDIKQEIFTLFSIALPAIIGFIAIRKAIQFIHDVLDNV